MARLIITADIHGSIHAWMKIKSILQPDDTLVVAGDLFDTIYSSVDKPDFQPEQIKNEFKQISCKKYYVYGNCDHEDFLKGQKKQRHFNHNGTSILLNHGHIKLPDLTDFDIIIEGHTHIAKLYSIMGKVFLNPGSPVLPRNGLASYAILEENSIKIINFKNDTTISELDLTE